MNFTFQGNCPTEKGTSAPLKNRSVFRPIVFSKRIFLILQLAAFLLHTSGNYVYAATPPRPGGSTIATFLQANYEVDTLIARHSSNDMIIVVVRQDPSIFVKIFNFINLVSLIINNLGIFKRRSNRGNNTEE